MNLKAPCVLPYIVASCFAGAFCARAQDSKETTKDDTEAAKTPEPRVIDFSGYGWRVKNSTRRVGPGSNYFSDKEENVRLDEQGRLHLRIAQREGRWYCAEVVSQKSFGLGTYRFYLATPVGEIDPNVTLGLFTWSDARDYVHREIDVELAKWGNSKDTNNAQFVVQPYEPAGHLVRFCVPPDAPETTHIFRWENSRVTFLSLVGHAIEPREQNPVNREWTFSKKGVPQPGDENARINLWLSAGKAPKSTNAIEVIISKFDFEPGPAKGSTPEVSILTPPPAGLKAGPVGTERVAGSTTGIKPIECKVLVYAYGDRWNVQPSAVDCDTVIGVDGSWATTTHGGTEYAALLVKAGYSSAPTLTSLPTVGGDVLAVVRVTPKD